MESVPTMTGARRMNAEKTDRPGPVERLIAYLSARAFTSFSVLMIPFHILFAIIMLMTPQAHIDASPVYSRLTDMLPVEAYAAWLILMALAIMVGILRQWWAVARMAYTIIAFWWFLIAVLVYQAATTLLSPAVYALIGVVCLYRQAEIAVSVERGRE